MESANHLTLAEDFLRRYPPTGLDRPFSMQLTRQWIEEAEQAWPGVNESLRACSLAAVVQPDIDLVRRALQCLAFVGQPDDVPRLKSFTNHPIVQVAQDARTCLYEIEHR